MTARSLFPGLDAHTSLGSAAGLLPSAKTFANQLPGSERNGMTAGDFITNLAALNNIVSQQLARPSQARSIEGNDMLQSICSGSPSMSQTSGELHNGDSFKTQDLDIATLLPEEQDLMCFEEFEGSATQQRLPTHYHDTKESVRSTFTALHSLEELLLRPVILEGTSTSTGPTSVSAMENHLMPLKLSSVQTIKPGRWSINTKGAVALLKSRRS